MRCMCSCANASFQPKSQPVPSKLERRLANVAPGSWLSFFTAFRWCSSGAWFSILPMCFAIAPYHWERKIHYDELSTHLAPFRGNRRRAPAPSLQKSIPRSVGWSCSSSLHPFHCGDQERGGAVLCKLCGRMLQRCKSELGNRTPGTQCVAMSNQFPHFLHPKIWVTWQSPASRLHKFSLSTARVASLTTCNKPSRLPEMKWQLSAQMRCVVCFLLWSPVLSV